MGRLKSTKQWILSNLKFTGNFGFIWPIKIIQNCNRNDIFELDVSTRFYSQFESSLYLAAFQSKAFYAIFIRDTVKVLYLCLEDSSEHFEQRIHCDFIKCKSGSNPIKGTIIFIFHLNFFWWSPLFCKDLILTGCFWELDNFHKILWFWEIK